MNQRIKKSVKILACICFTLTVFLGVGIFTKSVSADEVSDFVINDKNMLVKYNGPGGDIIIPANVKSIAYGVFSSMDNITSVYIPDSVTEINSNVFKDCANLKTVRMPSHLDYLGSEVFYYCKSLTSISCIPEGLNEIKEYTFGNCEKLSGDIIIPNGVTKIDSYAFYVCENIDSVRIPDSVTYIDNFAFAFTGIKSINIPDTVKSLGEGVVHYCPRLVTLRLPASVETIKNDKFGLRCESLTRIDVDDANPTYCSVDGALYNKDKTKLLSYPFGKPGEITYPSTIKIIGRSVFEDNEKFTEIKIPDTVTTIESSAFAYSNIVKVKIPDSVTSLGSYAFDYCTRLEDVQLSKNIESIECNTFYTCCSLKSIDIPGSVISIGVEAFRSCNNLKKVVFHPGLKTIQKTAFYGTPQEDIVLPEGLTTIGDSAFYNPNAYGYYLEDVTIKVTIPNSVTEIGSYAFSDCYIYGHRGSYAESYAAKYPYCYKFVCIDDIQAPTPSDPVDTPVQGNPANTPAPEQEVPVNSGAPVQNAPINSPVPVQNNAVIPAQQSNVPAAVTTYSIQYILNKGTNNAANQESYPAGTNVVLKNPSRKGYTFAGWYSDKKLKNKASNSFAISGNLTVYAKWKKISVGQVKLGAASNVKGKKLKLSWKALKGVTGYQVQYAKDCKVAKKNSLVVGKLNKGKSYTVRIRAFKKDSTGNNVYGKWSKTKNIKINK